MKTFESSKYGKKLAVVCCYYNPCNYSSRFLNYISFIERIKRYNVHVVTVEAYSFKSKYRVDKLNINTISVRCTQSYWMKECLLNIGIRRLLSEGYENIAWVDADIMFKSNSWPESILEGLSTNNVVQIFENCHEKISTEVGQETTDTNQLYTHGRSTISNSSSVDILSSVLSRTGELGYGYAYNSHVLSECKLYDSAILGAGDFANILGCVYNDEHEHMIRNDRFFHNTSEDFIQDYIKWASRMSASVENKIGYCKEDILVLPHGSRRNRKYVTRENIIKRYKFRPTDDLIKSQSGVYTLSNRLVDMSRDIEVYFKDRKEDSSMPLTTKRDASHALTKINFYTEQATHMDIETPASYLMNYKNIHTSDYTNDTESVISYILNGNVAKNKPVGDLNNDKSNLPFIVVFSRHTNKPNRLTGIPHLVYSKSGTIIQGEYTIPTNRHSISHTYITYIINNYSKLPEHILFCNDITMTDEILSWVGSKPTSGSYETHTKRHMRIPMNAKGHLGGKYYWMPIPMKRSTYDFKTWFLSLFPGTTPPSRYVPGSTFCVSRKTIRNRSLGFYQALLKTIPTSGYCEEDHYLECTWQTIFK